MHHSLVEEVSRKRRQKVEADRSSACRLAKNSDIVRIATKLANVVLDPLQGHQLVEHGCVARHVLGVKEHEAQ